MSDDVSSRPSQAGDPPWLMLISAGLFLYVGFMLGLQPLDSAPALYQASVHAFVWMARIVGVGLLLTFFMALAGGRYALLDRALAAIAAIGCLVCGAVWLLHGDTQGVLLLLFGAFNASGAWRSGQGA